MIRAKFVINGISKSILHVLEIVSREINGLTKQQRLHCVRLLKMTKNALITTLL